jgi:zinc protease
VAEERRMRTEDNPIAMTREAFNATAFVNSPYHHPIVGWMSDINHYEAEDLRDWYQKWYAPNNATIVVAGDVEADAVYKLAEKYFGKLTREVTAVVKPQIEVPQLGMRKVIVQTPAKLPYLMMGWKVPVVKTTDVAWEPYALEMLAGILDGGASARFSRELVRGKEIATSIGAGYGLFSRLDDLFIVAGTPTKAHTVPELEQAVMQQIVQLQTELVSEQELKRIKAQVVANKTYERDSVFYQAMQIGMLETIGLDWRLSEEYVKNIDAVTAQQVQAVARKYFIDKTLTVAELLPQPIGDKPRPKSSFGVRHGY